MNDAMDSSGSILFDFADQLLSDIDAGRLRPLAHYLERFPGHEERVAREYLTLTSPATDANPVLRTRTRRLERIGPYEIAEVLGRGGQGVVYRAVDRRLDRSVALKVLTIHVASVSQGRRARFRREAEILARLDHPGICAVLDADLDGELPYIAMRYVEGETLASALIRVREERERQITPDSRNETATSASRILAPRRALDLSESLSFFERAARALHAAHEAGVVHRDVKPGNIMVSTDGAPVILDFGLARGDDDESAQLTRSDEVFGTPAYISPEQLVSGRHLERATDVYSLGVVLYECLTLERPFQADSNAGLAEAIRTAPIPSPRKLNASLPSDLAIVLATAMERDIRRRYPTALEFAEELRRVREYEPIQARPAGPLLRLRRFGQRNPVLATGTIGSIAALSIALSVALVLLGRVRTEERRKQAVLALYEGGWFRDQAAGSMRDGPPRALDFAIRAAEQDPGIASNRVLLAALETLHERAVLIGHTDVVYGADIDASSSRIATASPDGTVRIWDAATGRETAALRLDGRPIHTVRFSPDGTRVAFAGTGGRASVVAFADPDAPRIELAGNESDVHSLDFDATGTRIVTAARDGTARVFDAASGQEITICRGHTGSVAEARFVRGGSWIFTRSAEPIGGSMTSESDGTKRLFDARTGRELCTLAGSSALAPALDASADGRWIATGCADRTAQIWDLDVVAASIGSGDELPVIAPTRMFPAPGRYHSLRFSPDSRSLALSWDAGAKVVDVATGADRYVLPDHDHRAIVRIAFSPDGRQLATVAYDDALRLFRAQDGELLRTCRGSAHQIMGLAWSPDGSFLTTWQRQSSASVWYGGERPFLPVLRGHTGAVRSARFSWDGARVLTSSDDGTARSWNAPSGAPEHLFEPPESSSRPLLRAEFDVAARRVLTTDAEGRVVLFDARDAHIERVVEPRSQTVLPAAFSPDGSRAALADGRGGIAILDFGTSVERRFAAHDGELTALRFSQDGQRLATGGNDRTVCVWDVEASADKALVWRSKPFLSDLRALTSVFDVAFSPDGRWVAAAEQGLHVEVFDEGGNCIAHTNRTTTQGFVLFAPDQGLLLSASKYSRSTFLWQFPNPSRPTELVNCDRYESPGEHHTNSLTALARARSAPWAVTGSLDGTARLWDLERRCGIASFSGHMDSVFDADIDPSGTWIVTASGDATARLWPCDLLAAAKRARPEGFTTIVGPLPEPKARE